MVTAILEKQYILEESDLYKIIGIEESCEADKLNKVYRSLAKQYHPDLLVNYSSSEHEQAARIFTKITSAYNVLKDAEKRKNYDYERRLKLEYEKTLQFNQSFALNNNKPTDCGIRINISTNPNQVKSKIAEESKNNQSETLYNLALNKFSSGNPDGAILDLQTAIVLNNKVSRYHSTLGLIMKEKGWNAYAQAHFKAALNIDKNDKLALKYYELPAKTEPLNLKIVNNKKPKDNKKVKNKRPFYLLFQKFLAIFR